MRLSHRSTAAVLCVALLAACHDAVAPPRPTTIEIASGDLQTGTVGAPLPSPIGFVVRDENGRVMAGVSVVVVVAAGNGTLTNAPSRTLDGAPTRVGTWTLGHVVGANQLTITVAGLPAVTISAAGVAGAPAKIIPATIATLSARAGEIVVPAPTAHVTDAFDNLIANATVALTTTGGGTAPASVVTDASGKVSVPGWTVGTVVGQNSLTFTAGAATASFVASVTPGDPAQIIVISGDAQRGLAGAALPAPIVLRVADRYGNAVPSQSVTIAVTQGEGVLSAATAASAADASITLPTWTLGRSAVPQSLHVISGAFGADLSATVQTNFHIDVRFYGPLMTDAQRALFSNAAARLSAIITGDIPDATLVNLDVGAGCGLTGLPVLNETIDDVVIYASVQNIDGPGKILAQAGPCELRPASQGYLTSVGAMEFDSADINSLSAELLQGVITHEMLHVLGFGILWSLHSLVTASGQVNVAFQGPRGRQGCVDDGGSAVCAAGVPVENNGVPGTADAHWRETVFRTELMTGYVNAGGMPLSAITVGSLGDLGYVVNPLAADPYVVPAAGASANLRPSALAPGWEGSLPLPGRVVPPRP